MGYFVTRRTQLPRGNYSIADLARREGINEKSARDRLRKYFNGTLHDFGISKWTYGSEDLEFVLSIIRPQRGASIADTDRHSAELSPAISPQPTQPAYLANETVARNANPYAWLRKPRIELTLPRTSGVYALFLRENSSLSNISPLEEGLIYIGLGRNLANRCHFRGRTEGHSPRRSLAALLWQELDLTPELAPNGNYKLCKSSESRLDAWMHDNILMAFNAFDNFEDVEDDLIRRFAPPLNLTKCMQSQQHKTVKDMRKAMLQYSEAHAIQLPEY